MADWNIQQVTVRSNMGWSPTSEQIEKFQKDTEAGFAEVKAGRHTVKEVADALHVSPATLQHYYDKSLDQTVVQYDQKKDDGTMEKCETTAGAFAAVNMSSQVRTTANILKKWVDDFMKEFEKAFKGES